MRLNNRFEKLLWSIALPGFAQLLDKSYFKGSLLVVMEFLVNIRSHLNEVIMLSFQGETQAAVEKTNFQWLLFYPCIYMFSMWDAYRGNHTETPENQFAFLPFVTAAFFATIGLIYSPIWRLHGVLLGPVWLALLFCVIGLGFGWFIKSGLTMIWKENA